MKSVIRVEKGFRTLEFGEIHVVGFERMFGLEFKRPICPNRWPVSTNQCVNWLKARDQLPNMPTSNCILRNWNEDASIQHASALANYSIPLTFDSVFKGESNAT